MEVYKIPKKAKKAKEDLYCGVITLTNDLPRDEDIWSKEVTLPYPRKTSRGKTYYFGIAHNKSIKITNLSELMDDKTHPPHEVDDPRG